jgi:hypothetical protein
MRFNIDAQTCEALGRTFERHRAGRAASDTDAMNTDAAGVPIRSPSPTAERMRRHRERRRKGLRYFRVELRVTQIEMLIAKGYLDHKEHEYPGALQRAIDVFISDAFWTLERDT